LTSLERLLAEEPRHAAALCLTARVYANLGSHERAAACCRRASEAEPLAVAPYAVLAAIAEEDGDLTTAKDCLKKILYLAPASIPAYVDLSALYEREGDFARARKLRGVALDLLDALSADAPVEGYADRTAGDLARHLRQLSGERQ
jgi:chemotaxis protein methyltransferase CheR